MSTSSPSSSIREEDEEESVRQGKNGDWMQLKGVTLRSDRLIRQGEEVSIRYVGSGRSGHFRKVFDWSCCWCTGRCNKGAHRSEQAWINILEQTEEKQKLEALQEMERQIAADKVALPGIRRGSRGRRSARDRAGSREWKLRRFGEDLE
jgi:hypothetical protein